VTTALLSDLAHRWRADAERFRQLGQEGPAQMSEAHADELEARLRESEMEAVTLEEAAQLGGYSYSHLQHLVAAGEIENVGEKHAPRIRRCDVPRKPGQRTASHSKAEALDHSLRLHQAGSAR
jgi:hypothetical protein